MSDLTKLGLHFDEVNKVRIVDPDVALKTTQLREECNDFVQSVDLFKTIAKSFVDVIQNLSEEVDKEKMKAIGARNLVKSMTKQQEAQEQQLKTLILEKSTELERLRIRNQSLVKIESEQIEILERAMLN